MIQSLRRLFRRSTGKPTPSKAELDPESIIRTTCEILHEINRVLPDADGGQYMDAVAAVLSQKGIPYKTWHKFPLFKLGNKVIASETILMIVGGRVGVDGFYVTLGDAVTRIERAIEYTDVTCGVAFDKYKAGLRITVVGLDDIDTDTMKMRRPVRKLQWVEDES